MHARTHAHTQTHTYFPNLLKAAWRQLKSIGAGDREKVSWAKIWRQTKFEYVALRKGDCSRWKDQWKKRHATLGTFYICSEYGRCECQQRSGECVMECIVQAGRTDQEEQCQWSRCSKLWQTCILICVLQATSAKSTKRGMTCSRFGVLQTRRAAQFITRCTLRVFEEYQPTGTYSDLNETVREMWQEFFGLCYLFVIQGKKTLFK